MNKVIALDIGEVCMKLRPDRCLERLGFGPTARFPEEMLAAVDRLERGKISVEAGLEIFRRLTADRFNADQLLEAWNLLLGEEIPGMADLVGDLVGAGFRMIFFSDTSEAHLFHVYRELSFAHLVTGGIFSFEVGAKKPDPAMYSSFEKTYGKPGFYTDDRMDNIAAGRRRGWTCHQFVSAPAMRTAFQAAQAAG